MSADGLVLLDVKGGMVLASNAVGARIWQLMEEGRSRDEMSRRLAQDYGVPLDRARQDVEAFLSSLVSRGLASRQPR
jgi:hypothetical protein